MKKRFYFPNLIFNLVYTDRPLTCEFNVQTFPNLSHGFRSGPCQLTFYGGQALKLRVEEVAANFDRVNLYDSAEVQLRKPDCNLQ